MGAAILFVFCTTAPARVAAAWNRLVRRAAAAAAKVDAAAARAAADKLRAKVRRAFE